MTAWLLLFGGICIGAAGVTAVVACLSANQVELCRWISGKESGAGAARALLSAPSRVVGSALGVAATGALLAGLGYRALTDGIGPVALTAVTIFLFLPTVTAAIVTLPGAIGRHWAESTIEVAVPWVSRLSAVFAPVLPRGSTVRPRTDLTNQQLQRRSTKTVSSDDLTLVSGVLEFTEHQVREVMTPRTEIVAVSEDISLEDVCRVFVESGFSRLPVYHESLDHIVGMFYAFDILKLSPGGHLPIRSVTLVPNTRLCVDLLFELQRDRRQVAVVLDEYGGTAGIATMNDLLADLVEETFDTVQAQSYDDAPQPAVMEVSGAAPPADVAQQFGAPLPGGSETIGGLLSTAAGRIPRTGERFELAGLEFDVVAATATRVERVTVRSATVPVIRLGTGGTQ